MKFYGSAKGAKIWRMKNNCEIDATLKGGSKVRLIKLKRIRWLRRVERMIRDR